MTRDRSDQDAGYELAKEVARKMDGRRATLFAQQILILKDFTDIHRKIVKICGICENLIEEYRLK